MNTPSPVRPSRIPLWLKIAYTAFLAVMIPAYWINYGPVNFLYFCDVALCLASFWLLPPAGAMLADPRMPRNINYVFGMDDMKPQQWVDPGTYVFLWITALTALVFVPTHFVLKKVCRLSPAH
jgi:hypothetical protein